MVKDDGKLSKIIYENDVLMTIKPTSRIFTILGCGSSHGVPRSDGDWGACDPNNPRNRRRRASLLIEQFGPMGEKTTVVVDTGPDFREQMISARVRYIDAVIYTHGHADHIHGIGDLRAFAMAHRKRVQIYSDKVTLETLEDSFEYCFKTPKGSEYPPVIEHNLIKDMNTSIEIDGEGGIIPLMPIDLIHGPIHSLGFRIGNFAYCSDVSQFPEESMEKLLGLDTIIIDATLPKPHFSHFSLDQATEWVKKLGAKQAYITHMHTALDYDYVMSSTPEYIAPCYDGLKIEVTL